MWERVRSEPDSGHARQEATHAGNYPRERQPHRGQCERMAEHIGGIHWHFHFQRCIGYPLARNRLEARFP